MISCFLFGLFLTKGFGQKSFVNQRHLGGFISFGKAFYDLPEGEPYQPILLGASYHQPFYQSKGRFNVGFNILPQFNYVPRRKSIEFGVNVQLDVNYQIGNSNIVGIRFGAGPHYVNVNTARQAKGFIFSDNVAFNYQRKAGDYSLGLIFGVRHISNAGLQQPNSGIDNLITGIELLKLLH
ncbi:MAG: acyloxyacyl hydrolase [Saprospiraceae bacterium]|nr:acyloxyacyl hydrolase [Saprospiraceae bacterium]